MFIIPAAGRRVIIRPTRLFRNGRYPPSLSESLTCYGPIRFFVSSSATSLTTKKSHFLSPPLNFMIASGTRKKSFSRETNTTFDWGREHLRRVRNVSRVSSSRRSFPSGNCWSSSRCFSTHDESSAGGYYSDDTINNAKRCQLKRKSRARYKFDESTNYEMDQSRSPQSSSHVSSPVEEETQLIENERAARAAFLVLSTLADRRIDPMSRKKRRRRRYRSRIERRLSTKATSSPETEPNKQQTKRENSPNPTKTTVKSSPSSSSRPDKPLPSQLSQFQWQEIYHKQPPATPNEDTYRLISLYQSTTAKASREKTATNVRRALGGNIIICFAKLAAWMSSGSSAMLSEFVHSTVDCGNQALLLVGLRDSAHGADRRHPYGYGKSIYFWALVSALGTFWLGAGVSMRHSIEELIDPSLCEITWQVWGVLGFSLAVDGYVLIKTINGIRETQPENIPFWNYVWKIRDPATMAILLEDGAACMGVLIASTGIVLTHMSGSAVFDGLAGVGISGLLAGMGFVLARINQKFLLGQAVDPEIIAGIEKILLNRRSIDNVHSVQSQWTGPDTFSYKAEVDFDGTYLAAKLMPRYQKEFLEVKDTLDQDLRVLLSWYAEDVMRAVEREVRHIENEVRKEYPGAAFIELEPDSKDRDRFAIDDGMEMQLKRIEIESLNRYLKSLYAELLQKKKKDTTSATTVSTTKEVADKLKSEQTKSHDRDQNETVSGNEKKVGSEENNNREHYN